MGTSWSEAGVLLGGEGWPDEAAGTTERYVTPEEYRTDRSVWSQTIRRELVHRASVADVLLTRLSRGPAADSFVVAAQWPRAHSFYRHDRRKHHDPFLIAETLRQGGVAVAHSMYDISLGFQFIMCDMHFTVVDPERLVQGPEPTNLLLHLSLSDTSYRAEQLKKAKVSVQVCIGEYLVAVASATMRVLPKAAYLKFASRHGAGASPRATTSDAQPIGYSPLPPAVVGRRDPADVMLAVDGAGDSWQLRIDTGHPVLFDHPVDHVPGIAQLEAARQAALAFTGCAEREPLITSCDADFDGFVRLDRPAECHAAYVPVRSERGCGRGRGRPTKVSVIIVSGSAAVSAITLGFEPSGVPDDTAAANSGS